MITLETDSGGFECPHCKQKWSVQDWDTEYNDPIPGTSRVFCSSCDKYFNIDVCIEVKITSFI